MNPDMSDALMGEEMAGDLGPEADMLGDPAMDEGDGLGLGAGDEAELDQLFAAEAQAIFPDFDDDQLLALQKLIDSRAASLSAPAPMDEPELEDSPEEELGEGDLGL